MPYAEEPENNLGGFVVEAGLATFCDANAVSAYEIFSDKWYGNDIEKNIYDYCCPIKPLHTAISSLNPAEIGMISSYLKFQAPH